MPDVVMAVLDKAITRSTEQSEDSKQYFVSTLHVLDKF